MSGFALQRLGIALEPEADYELRTDGSGGFEDPRITFVERFQRYVMTYTAFSPVGPRIGPGRVKGLVSMEATGARDFFRVSGHRFHPRGQ